MEDSLVNSLRPLLDSVRQHGEAIKQIQESLTVTVKNIKDLVQVAANQQKQINDLTERWESFARKVGAK